MIATFCRPAPGVHPLRWMILLACVLTPALLSAQVSVWTWRNDNSRVGVNAQETILTPNNVNSQNFGKLFSQVVDGQIYAQPLYLPNVSIPGKGVHNVVFVATENDSVYAFDADDDHGTDGSPLWHDSFIDPPMGIRPVASGDNHCGDIQPETGITGTPVINTGTGTLYVVTKTWENGQAVQRLHALDVATGNEKEGGPVTISASVDGQGSDNQNGVIQFDPLMENQRMGLLLNHGVIYIGWASTCDHAPWHGWLMAYDAYTLQQIAYFNATPNGNGGGFWQAGAAPAADDAGNVYVENANGTLDANQGGNDYASTILRFRLNGNQLTLADNFIPFNADFMNITNEEPSSGAILLPDQGNGVPPLVLAASKIGNLYLLNRNQFGGFHAGSDSEIVQALQSISPGITSTPVYWNGNLYLIGGSEFRGPDVLKVFSLRQGRLSLTPVMTDSQPFGFPGASPVISSNGNSNGVLWALRVDGWESGGPAVLYAWDAQSLQRLYSSDSTNGRDDPGAAIKFSVPVVANGKVYVGTQDRLSVYGLLANDFSFTLTPATQTIDAGDSATLTVNTASSGAAPLSLQCGTPSSCTVDPVSVQPGGTATVTIAPGALATGSQSVKVSADNGAFQHQETATVQVQDFSLWLPSNQGAVQSGSSIQTTIQLTSAGGYTPPANLGCDQLPAGIHCSFSPATIDSQAPASTLTLNADASAAGGTDAINVVATHGHLHHSAVYSLQVLDYQLQASPSSVSVSPKDSANVTVSATGPSSSQETIQLSCGPVQGVTCSFQPATIHPGQSSQLVLSHLDGAGAGVLGIPIIGTLQNSSPAASAQVPLNVNIFDFQVGTNGAQQVVNRGQKSAQFTIATQPENGMTQPVQLTCSVAAPAVCSLAPEAVPPGQSSVLTVGGLDQTTGSTVNVSVQGAYGADTHAVALAIGFRDFGLASAQPSATIQPGTDSIAVGVSTSAMNGFSDPIQLSCNAARVRCAFNPATVPPGGQSTATVSGLNTVSGNSLQLAIEGTSSEVTHSAEVEILIGDFALSAASYSGDVVAGQTGQFPLTVTSYNQFQGPVQLACSGAPANSTCTITPATATLSSGGTTQVQLSVSTTARTVAPIPPDSRERRWPLLWMGIAGMLLLLCVRPRWRPALGLALLLAAEVACGNGAPPRGTPGGTTTLSITATSGTVHHILPFELTVK